MLFVWLSETVSVDFALIVDGCFFFLRFGGGVLRSIAFLTSFRTDVDRLRRRWLMHEDLRTVQERF